MIYILFIYILVLLIYSWFANKKEIFSASFLYLFISFIWVGLAISSMDFYGVNDIHINTFYIVSLSFLFFLLGEQIATKTVSNNRNSNKQPNDNDRKYIEIKLFILIIMIIVPFINLYLSYISFKSFLMSNGFGTDLTVAFALARDALTNGRVVYNKSMLLSQLGLISSVISFFLFYSYCRNDILYKKKNYLRLIPIIPLVLESLLSTSRNGFIRYFCILAIIYLLTYKKYKEWSVQSNKKVLRNIIVIFVIIIVVFRLSGTLTGKTQKLGLLENIYMYFSNSLFAFDSFINTHFYTSDFFAKNSFRSLYLLLNQFGANFPISDQFFSAYRFGLTGSDNILTGLCNPMIDFGFIGTLLTRFLLGFIYGRIFTKIKKSNAPINWIYMFYIGCFVYPLLMMPIADSLGSLCNLGLLYSLVYMIIIDNMFLPDEYKIMNIKFRFNLRKR